MRLRRAGIVAGVLATAAALLWSGHATAKPPPPGDDGDAGTMIVGGQPATETYSFMTSVQNSNGHFCGGSLIKPNWVVTAAHCADLNPSQVRVGTQTWNSGGSVARVVSQTKHPTWTGQGGSDIALLKLDQNVSQQPITIAATGGT